MVRGRRWPQAEHLIMEVLDGQSMDTFLKVSPGKAYCEAYFQVKSVELL